MFDISEQKAQEIMATFQIPVKPKILIQIQQEQAKPDPSPSAFAEVISQDVALSGAVLKTVNSPVFGLKRTLTDIKQSVMMLGCNNISNLVSFFQLKASYGKKSSISHEKYWDTAMETANMMTILLEQFDLNTECTVEEAYSFGLFRDCGIPLMAMRYEDYRQVLVEANNSHDTLFTDVEEQHYQTNHAIIGYFVASSWHLPKSLCELILRHHEDDFLDAIDATTIQKDLYALAKIASNILSQYHSRKDDPEWLLSKDAVLDYFGFSEIDYTELDGDAKDAFKMKYGLV